MSKTRIEYQRYARKAKRKEISVEIYMEDNQLEKSYLADLQTIKQTISENRYKALVTVNSTMILTYHRIGTIINERKEWGNKYIRRLSKDLEE